MNEAIQPDGAQATETKTKKPRGPRKTTRDILETQLDAAKKRREKAEARVNKLADEHDDAAKEAANARAEESSLESAIEALS